MAKTVREVMTPNPCQVELDMPLVAAAQLMRNEGIGDVVVTDGDQVRGILTDRDIVIRAVAEGMDPRTETVDTIYSGDVVTVTPDTPFDEAINLMRERAIRRLPVMDGSRAVGIVSLGDMAMAAQPDSVLADISEAPTNS